jgi:HD-GYP domain-containing protein (c-di-GMP phosphodiesterase class II)
MLGTGSRIMQSLPREFHGLIRKFQKLQEIGAALSAEKDLGALLTLILREARSLTGADSGSIYIREDEIEVLENATAKDTLSRITPFLVLKITQNDSLQFPFKEFRLPFDVKTVAGYVANSGEIQNLEDAYKLPAGVPFSYNRAFDEKSGYRCKSMLVVPMKNRDGDILGVLQVINKKKVPDGRLTSPAEVDAAVQPFDAFDEELLLSLASQAAVCIEKARLYDEIERMFEGLVQSFTLALERRNRTTFGHCMRVARYAVAIAEAVNLAPPEAFGGMRYSRDQIKELRYAALLHDIGKIAVPEAVLDKKNKLTDEALRAIEYRFHYWKQKLAAEGDPAGDLARIPRYLDHVRKVNVPTPLAQADSGLLAQVRAARFVDVDGVERPLLTDDEFAALAVERGNLTPGERKQIEQHIVDTWEILKRVPWPRYVARVPHIAACHHEKPNGLGYPWGFRSADIPMGGKILAIVDIFEALTAKDRPYKPAIPIEKALKILDDEEARGGIDSKLYQLFKDKHIYKLFESETGFVTRPEPATAPAS